MSQRADLGNVPNVSGFEYRTSVNGNIQAVTTKHAGPGQPPLVYPFMEWWDTTNQQIKVRTAANDAWTIAGTFDSLTNLPTWYIPVGSITSGKIANNAILGQDIALGTIPLITILDPTNAKAGPYFAAGDGVFNDTSALTAMFANASTNGGLVYLPAGSYQLGAKITVNTSGALSLIVRGDGRGATKLTWTVPNGGLDITYSDEHRAPQLYGMTLQTNQFANGTALKITSPSVASVTIGGPVIDDVAIKGLDTSAHCWLNGIHLVNCWYPFLHGISIKGFDDATAPFDMVAGIKYERCMAPFFRKLAIFHVENAIIEAGATFGEGVNFAEFELVGVTNGIVMSIANTGAGIHIGEGHINCYARGITMTSKPWMNIANMHILKTHVSTSNWVGIEVIECPKCTVIGNQIYGYSTATGANAGIVISGASTSLCMITGNRVGDFSVAGDGITLGTGVASNIITNNLGFGLSGGITVRVNGDAGSGNQVTGNF